MVLRVILRYLANNEQLIQRLSESYPMRRAAQMLVSAYYRSKTIAEEQKMMEMSPQSFRRMMNNLKKNIKQDIQSTKNDVKKQK